MPIKGAMMSTRPKILLVLVLLCPLTASAQDPNEEFLAAARKGDVAAIKSFLDKGVDVNTKTRYGATALSYACDKGHVEVVRLLIERGADVNAKDTFYGEVPLGWALSKGHAPIVKLLLDKGAAGIERALMEGVQVGNVEIVKVVIEKGGLKPETLNNALRRANSADNKEISELLKKAGAVAIEVQVEPQILNSYAGVYKNQQVGELTVEVKDGKLRGTLAGQRWFTTAAVNKNTFSIIEVEATITFSSEGDKVTGFTLAQGGQNFVFKRVEQK
ncbi:MAG: ankyrin repeat domain-containing protein [Blastocatellia bacterium]